MTTPTLRCELRESAVDIQRAQARQELVRPPGKLRSYHLYERLSEEDPQTAELYHDAFTKLASMLNLPQGAYEALKRLKDTTERGSRWDVGLIRNNVFKAANALGVRLPSGMF